MLITICSGRNQKCVEFSDHDLPCVKFESNYNKAFWNPVLVKNSLTAPLKINQLNQPRTFFCNLTLHEKTMIPFESWMELLNHQISRVNKECFIRMHCYSLTDVKRSSLIASQSKLRGRISAGSLFIENFVKWVLQLDMKYHPRRILFMMAMKGYEKLKEQEISGQFILSPSSVMLDSPAS